MVLGVDIVQVSISYHPSLYTVFFILIAFFKSHQLHACTCKQKLVNYPESAFNKEPATNNFQKILQFFVVLIIDLEAKQQIKHLLISVEEI